MEDDDVIDAEFTVVEPPLKWWQGWKFTFDPWPAIIAGATAFAVVAQRLNH